MTTYADHQHLIQKFKYLSSKVIPNLRLFDRHVGLFYTKNGTPVRIGMNGQADVWGLYNNGKNLIAIEIEFKTGNAVQSKDQKNWQSFIEKNNGIYFLARCDTDVYRLKTIIEVLCE